jgi:thiamine transport system ATP-binding protein
VRPAASADPERASSGSGLGVHDVVVRYTVPGRRRSTATAVDGVTLDVAPGEIVALLGPSGSGKSSLLRAIAGLEPLAAGDVTWGGVSVVGVPVHRRGFGLLFQDGQLFPHRDVAGNVGYGLRGRRVGGANGGANGGVDERGASRQRIAERSALSPPADRRASADSDATRVAELLELVGLPGQQHRDPATLSGGERQRVALARALAPRPRLLLLDEPLSALDRALRERLAEDLRAALVATGTTAVLVTHDQDEAFAVADRIAVMSEGRLLQVAAPGELWRAPASREVAAFLGYEAFIPASAPAARRWRTALRLADDDPRTLALAAGALVLRGPESTTADTPDGTRPVDDLLGTVLSIGARRGRTEVTVDLPTVGRLTAFAPAGWSTAAGARVVLRADPDGVALLP